MIRKCDGCGAQKDTDVKEEHQETEQLRGGLFDPLLPFDIQGEQIPNDPNGYCDFRQAMICIACVGKMDLDMWASQEQWENLKPVVPFEQLEKLP